MAVILPESVPWRNLSCSDHMSARKLSVVCRLKSAVNISQLAESIESIVSSISGDVDIMLSGSGNCA